MVIGRVNEFNSCGWMWRTHQPVTINNGQPVYGLILYVANSCCGARPERYGGNFLRQLIKLAGNY